jgi:nucleoside-diphosphate-sugar epimerase
MTTVALLGASGFVGSAVADALRRRGAVVLPVVAPRLPPCTEAEALGAAAREGHAVRTLAAQVLGADAVVNAAGLSDSGSTDVGELYAANAALPGVVGAAAQEAGVARFVHVSSAAVQGRRLVLDDSPLTAPFSAYSGSKALGEQAALAAGPAGSVVYRPPGVHDVGRQTTETLVRLARSRLASAAAPGDAPTPQALLANVGDAVAFLATCADTPPQFVTHPSEHLPTAGLLEDLGGKPPLLVPRRPAVALVAALTRVGARHHAVAAAARRLEVLWLGQAQAASWLDRVGWRAPVGPEGWRALGATARR